jgi:hypothetical protein
MLLLNNRKVVGIFVVPVLFSVGVLFYVQSVLEARSQADSVRFTDAETGFDEVGEISLMNDLSTLDRGLSVQEVAIATSLPPIPEPIINGRTQWAAYWQPMNEQEFAVYGNPIPSFEPRKVGIQIGHWQRENAPEELAAFVIILEPMFLDTQRQLWCMKLDFWSKVILRRKE